ncbi:MAG: transporter substrate-binding domain-containing protein [Saprospiraceae bacterium]
MTKTTHLLLIIFLILINSPINLKAQDNLGYVYGVFIAIDDYQGNIWSPLALPTKDADAISSILTTQYAFDDIIKLYDTAATRRTILDTLTTLCNQLNANDQLLIYFSGHSMMIQDEGYWIPSNTISAGRTQMISNTEVKDIIVKSKSKHILIISDALFTGESFIESENYAKNEGDDVAYYNLLQTLNGRQVITSGNKNPVTNGSGDNSIFARYLIKFLLNNNKELLPTSDLFNLIKYPIAANSPNVPQFGHLQDANHEGGQFVFPVSIEPEPEPEKPVVDCSYLTVEFEEGKSVTFNEEKRILHVLSTAKTRNISYQWFRDIETFNINSPNFKVPMPGEYTVVVNDDNLCTKAATIEVNINYPDAYITIREGKTVEFMEEGVLYSKTNVKGLETEWLQNDFIVGNKDYLEVTKSGTYTVNLKQLDGKIIATATSNVTVKNKTYTVQVGDDIGRLARKFYDDEDKKNLILNANPEIAKNGGALRVGDKIEIPSIGKDDWTKSTVKVAGIKGLVPLSASGIYNNGIITDITLQVLKQAKLETSLTFIPLEKLKEETYKGTFTIAQPLVKTEADEANFYYSEPLYKILNVFFVKKNDDFEYTDNKDLKGKRIAITKGISIKELDVLADKRKINLVSALTLEIAFQMLANDQVDMIAAPQLVGLLTLKNMTTLSPDNFRMLSNDIGSDELYLVVSKNHPNGEEIIEKFNKSLAKMKLDDKIEELINKHLDNYLKP